ELAMLSNSGEKFWGRCDVRLGADAFVYRIIEFLMNWRSRLTGIATGDQAMFVSRDLFDRSGGFPNIALMEDIALSNLLRQMTAPVCLSLTVRTSARRWQCNGVLRTILTMWCLRAAFFFGVSPQRLNAIYERSATRAR
ncbi:MAG: glycosyl transferase, partial [Proteobacteria bacterium]|nr:glycosyl transferase [Pseudomonadota bacterium]